MDNERNDVPEWVRKEAASIVLALMGASVYGVSVDFSDVQIVALAAYWLGRQESGRNMRGTSADVLSVR